MSLGKETYYDGKMYPNIAQACKAAGVDYKKYIHFKDSSRQKDVSVQGYKDFLASGSKIEKFTYPDWNSSVTVKGKVYDSYLEALKDLDIPRQNYRAYLKKYGMVTLEEYYDVLVARGRK